MDIVDAQVHLDFLYRGSNLADPEVVLRTAITAMDAVGISGVMIVEGGPMMDKRLMPQGTVKGFHGFSKRAVELFPNRFAYGVIVDPKDPDPAQLVAEVRPEGGSFLRLDLGDDDVVSFAEGKLNPLLRAAELHEVPIFMPLSKQPLQILDRCLEAFPALTLVLDHAGVGALPPRGGWSETRTLVERIAEIDRVLELAQHPNVAVKWAYGPAKFSTEPYPYADSTRQLLRYLDAFGSSRVMWASDYTMTRRQHTWAESLHHLRDSPLLTDDQKRWLLGGAARAVIDWPVQRSRTS